MKLLLVDDERRTRNLIISNLSWKDIGIDIVEEAGNGQDAIDILLDLRPEIIMTDIRMPLMDGIEFAKKVRKVLPNSRIIFMSAFSDKKYLKSAISLKIDDYVEKPINLEELENSLKTAVSEFDKIDKLNTESKLINKRLANSIPILKADIAKGVCKQRESYDNIRERIKYVAPSVTNESIFISAIVCVDVNGERDFQANIQYLQYEIEKYLNKYNLICFAYVNQSNNIVVHATHKDYKSANTLYRYLNQLFDKMIKNFSDDFNIFIGIGRDVKGISNIYKSYLDAEITQHLLFFHGYNIIMTYKVGEEQFVDFKQEASNFKKYLQEEKYEHVICNIKKFNRELIDKGFTSIKEVKNFYANMCQIIVKLSSLKNISVFSNVGGDVMIWSIIRDASTLVFLETFIIKKIQILKDEISNKNLYSKSTNQIINMITSNYTDQKLSVKSISEALFMNKAYMCVLFKKDTGKTINQFITNYRIEKSLDLLKEKEKRISEIAVLVGYKNSNYYAKVFKKDKEVSPSEFRENL